MLKIRYLDDRKPPFWAMEKTFSIGRSQTNHLSLDDPTVDETHAHIFNRGDTFVLKDAGSETGTFVNGTQVTQKNISCGDQLTIGNITLEIVDPTLDENSDSHWALIANSSWLNGQEFPLNLNTPHQSVTLGRERECDIVIPGTHLSRKHAMITLNNNELSIKDLGSANGTFVNNKKIDTARVLPGDQVRLDVYSFKIFGPGINLPRAATQTFKAISPELIASHTPPEDRLWKTRASSPGNRIQENLYKNNSWPLVIAGTLICAFVGGAAFYLFGS